MDNQEKQELSEIVENKKDDIQIIKEEVHAELLEIKELKQILIQKQESFSGPIPHPEHLKKYNQIVPGSANRILKMAESDLEHIQKIQTRENIIESIATVGGLIAGFIIAVIALIGSGYLIMEDHDVAGTILGGGSLTALVGIFIKGRNTNKPKS